MGDIFKMLKGKVCQPNIPYLDKLFFEIEEGIKTFSDKQKIRELITSGPAYKKCER